MPGGTPVRLMTASAPVMFMAGALSFRIGSLSMQTKSRSRTMQV